MLQERIAAMIKNRKARFEFEVLERVEAGIVLLGTEIQGLRDGRASLAGAFARIENGTVRLFAMHIDPHPHSAKNHEPLRTRTLLLHRREIDRLRPKVEQRGLTLVPMAVYFNEHGRAKVDLALVRGKNKRDKRRTIMDREHDREMQLVNKGRGR